MSESVKKRDDEVVRRHLGGIHRLCASTQLIKDANLALFDIGQMISSDEDVDRYLESIQDPGLRSDFEVAVRLLDRLNKELSE